MNKTTSKLVSIERAIEILEAYGADSSIWPKEERAAAMALVMGSGDLQKKLNSARELDNVLKANVSRPSNTLSHKDSKLLSRIIDELPEQAGSNSTARGQNRLGQWSSFGAGALAASLFIAVVTFFTLHESATLSSGTQVKTVQFNELDQMLWDDVTMDVVQIDDDGPATISFMTLIDMES